MGGGIQLHRIARRLMFRLMHLDTRFHLAKSTLEDLYFGFAWSKTWYSMDQYVLDPAMQNSPVNIDRATSDNLVIGGGIRF